MKSTLTIHATAVIRVLAAAIGFLVLASTVSTMLVRSGVRPNAHRFFFVDNEANIPACFSIMQLLFAAGLLTIITLAERSARGVFARHWTVLTAGFFLMAADEMCSIHEMLTGPMRGLLGNGRPLGVLNYAWVLPALILVGAIGLYFLRFLLGLPKRTRRDFILAAAVFLGGAIGMEMLNGWQHEIDSRELGRTSHQVKDLSVRYIILITIEEGMEMTGILLFVRALLLHLARTRRELAVEFFAEKPAP